MHSALIYYWVGRKKSEFFKNGFKPLLLTSWGTHNSNFIFGRFFGPILDRFWAQKTKNRPKKEFHFFDFLLLFVSIVIKSFNTVNWCVGLVYYSLGCWNQNFIFKLVFGPILSQFWSNFGLRSPKIGQIVFFKIVGLLLLLIVLW